jgi:orotate phosphoribosyltransferase
VIFYYGIFDGVEETLGNHGVQLISLCTWWDVLAEAKARGAYDDATLTAVEAYLNDPSGWKPA